MSVEFAVILVESTSQALRIEKLLTGQGYSCKLIPVPRHLSSDCGVCLRILKQNAAEIKTLLTEIQINSATIEEI